MAERMKTGRERQLLPGNVLMVARLVTPKDGGKPYVWRYFMVVTEHWSSVVKGINTSSTGKFKDREMQLRFYHAEIYYLPEEEWPDGVHVSRLRLILLGLVEIV